MNENPAMTFIITEPEKLVTQMDFEITEIYNYFRSNCIKTLRNYLFCLKKITLKGYEINILRFSI